MVVIDEAHRLKNRNCKLLEGLNNLQMVSTVVVAEFSILTKHSEGISVLKSGNDDAPHESTCSPSLHVPSEQYTTLRTIILCHATSHPTPYGNTPGDTMP